MSVFFFLLNEKMLFQRVQYENIFETESTTVSYGVKIIFKRKLCSFLKTKIQFFSLFLENTREK